MRSSSPTQALGSWRPPTCERGPARRSSTSHSRGPSWRPFKVEHAVEGHGPSHDPMPQAPPHSCSSCRDGAWTMAQFLGVFEERVWAALVSMSFFDCSCMTRFKTSAQHSACRWAAGNLLHEGPARLSRRPYRALQQLRQASQGLMAEATWWWLCAWQAIALLVKFVGTCRLPQPRPYLLNHGGTEAGGLPLSSTIP